MGVIVKLSIKKLIFGFLLSFNAFLFSSQVPDGYYLKNLASNSFRGLKQLPFIPYNWLKTKIFQSNSETDRKIKKENEDSLLTQICFMNQLSFSQQMPSDKKRPNYFTDAYCHYAHLYDYFYSTLEKNNSQRAFQILSHAEQQVTGRVCAKWLKESIINKITWNDLNLFCGPLIEIDAKKLEGDSKKIKLHGKLVEPKEVYVGSILSKYITSSLGKAYLYGLIGRPTDDVFLLISRQEIIRTLLGQNSNEKESKEKEVKDSSQTFNTLQKELDNFSKHEQYLTQFWDSRFPDMAQMDYFHVPFSSYLNRSSSALQLKALKGNADILIRNMLVVATPVLLPLYVFWSMYLYNSTQTDQNGSSRSQIPSWLSEFANGTALNGGDSFSLLSRMGFFKIFMLWTAYDAAYWIKYSIQSSHSQLLEHDLMLKILMHVSQVFKSMKRIHSIIKELPKDITTHFTFFLDLDEFINTKDNNLKLLFSLLEKNTFDLEPDNVNRYYFNYGRVLCAWKLLTENLKKFEIPLSAIGEIGAFTGLASLMAEQPKQKNLKFYFVNYITDSRYPIIDIKNFCNLFVNPNFVVSNNKIHEAVINDASFGERFDLQNMVLTGPNTGGKSMTSFGICQQLILAQSVGITLGETTITPFSNFETYRNISDSPIDQESRFGVEALRTIGTIEKINKLAEDGKFSFAVFDELYSGTNPRSASNLTYDYALELGKKYNSISIISTHFLEATKLEKTGRFVNYQVPVLITNTTPRKVTRLFKLQKGICTQDISREVLEKIAGGQVQWLRPIESNQNDCSTSAASSSCATSMFAKESSENADSIF